MKKLITCKQFDEEKKWCQSLKSVISIGAPCWRFNIQGTGPHPCKWNGVKQDMTNLDYILFVEDV